MGRPPAGAVLPLAALLLAGTVAGVGMAAGPSAAAAVGGANGVATVSFEPRNLTVSRGETAAVAVVIDSQPTLASGVYAATLTVAVDPTYARMENVTPGGYMWRGRNTTVRTTERSVDAGAGTATLGLERDPPRGGVDGEGRFATVRFVVREDAPAGRFDVALRDAELVLTDEALQRVVSGPATVTVSGDGASRAGTGTGTGTGDAARTGTETATNGGTPFGIGWPLLALAAAALVAAGAWILRRV